MGRSPFSRYGVFLAAFAVFAIPFKLTFGYIGLIPLIVLWLDHYIRFERSRPELFSNPTIDTFILFLAVAAVTSVFGINPARSATRVGTLFFFPLTIAAFYDLGRTHSRELLFSLGLGQALACLSSVAESAFAAYTTSFLGPVSQSGQITLTFFAATALLVCSWSDDSEAPTIYKLDLFLGSLLLLALIAVGFHSELSIPLGVSLGLSAILLGIAFSTAFQHKNIFHQSLIARFILPLIAAGLVVNLKRGPWAGVLVGFGVFSLLHRPKLLLYLAGGMVVSVLALDPVRSRLLHIHEHFFLSGGRNTIWEIGYELAMKYPLGIGFENSGFLRSFSTDIPSNLKHFHNNALNLLVETGWAGCALYCISMVQFILIGFQRSLSRAQYRATTALACGLIAWQVAGLVEYNFGDSSVVTVAYVLLGILLAQSRKTMQVSTPLLQPVVK